MLLSKMTRSRAAIIAALKDQAARAAAAAAAAAADSGGKSSAVPSPACGRFQPDVPPLVHARWRHFSAQGLDAHESAAVTAVLVWALHANTSAALFWTVAHIFSGEWAMRLFHFL